jgi:hypothetical protein
VDVDARTVRAAERHLGWGFTSQPEGRLDRFSYQGRTIGRLWSFEKKAAEGWLAAQASPEEPTSVSSYRDVAVWSVASKTWRTLRPGWTNRILGWVVPAPDDEVP